MRYRLTCLTPLLVGDGRKLSPIDYMVWKDHVNVLDQWRIFRLLAKGPPSAILRMEHPMSKSLIAVLLVPLGLISGQELKPVALPTPQTSGGKPLMQVLKERKSVRDFGPEQISRQMLSNLLWAAWGVNREDGRRTAPSASNRQEIDVYAIVAEGAYLYDAKGNALKPVTQTDMRKLAGTQAYAADAPVNLIYVADTAKLGGDDAARLATANADTGFIAQNVYLFCASEGLGTVVRGSVNRADLGKAMNLRAEQRIILAQSVGYPKQSPSAAAR